MPPSPSHFLRAFRATCGLPPHRYVITRRIARAESLLLTTDLPLAAVAEQAGFANNSHLTTMMRRLRGYTPTGLRRGGRNS